MEIMYIEKMMERFNSGELKRIFRNISRNVIVGLTESGRRAWQEEEETSNDTSTALILQENSCTSEPFKVIQGRNLIDPTLQDNVVFPSNVFQYIYHIGCAINLHSIVDSGLVPGRQHLNNRQTVILSACGIPWTKIIRILRRSTWMNRVMHNTCIKHGRDIRTQCIGSTSILLWGKDWSSIRLDRTRSFFTKHFQLIVFRKLLG